jgi:hypothetical protein
VNVMQRKATRAVHGLVTATAVFLGVTIACQLVPPQSWRSDQGPVVPHDTFPADCSLCHLGSDWHTIRPDFTFDHAKQTGVPLFGAHERAQCLRCHNDRGPVAAFAAKGCAGCHEDVHEGHLGRNCRDCHDERDWLPREQIARHLSTRFPLVGAHAAVSCHLCHPGAMVGNFQRADTQCESCHSQDLARATNPNHFAQGWTRDCNRCHVPTDWRSARFEHSFFPLTGAHGSARCAKCHPNGVFRGTPRQCVACHRAEYDATTDPNHMQAAFSTDCESCHTTTTWRGARYAHTSWPLTGAHVALRCSRCHGGGVYRGTPTACVGCHRAAYDATTDPHHSLAGFSTDCESCHSTATWQGGRYTHGWPLTGAHATARCARCHGTGVYRGTPTACAGCHLDDYNATRNPDHRLANFPTTCEACHTSTVTWRGGTFNHRFPIAGPHRRACTECHTTPNNFAVFTCTGCHTGAHSQAKMDPKHRAVNGYSYSTPACYQCHPNGRH